MVRVPVRNIWLLQLFASDLYRAKGESFAGAESTPEDLPRMVADILSDEVTRRLHTGLSVGFSRTDASVRRVRGRIDLLSTERRQLLDRGLINCQFDETVTDTLGNRLVKSALERAAVLIPTIGRYRALALQLAAAGVSGPRPRLADVPGLRHQRLLARDQLMLAAADLVLTLSIPDPSQKTFSFHAPYESDEYLRALFEKAAYGFYRMRLQPQGWRVEHSKKLYWSVDKQSEGMQAIFPGMKTDIVLTKSTGNEPDSPNRRIIIDTKFTSITSAGWYRENTLKSGYVYQIYAYLMSQSHNETTNEKSEGLMLHPVVHGHVDEEITIRGHRIRFVTVDLQADATSLARQLIEAIEPPKDYDAQTTKPGSKLAE
ncbi:hypothetical protein CH296_18060 [Rhodococcus sp. 14-2496-1d]|uniref:5-methylcytosine restriction system specificity protein McrC n=1 Tax=Rhodococcus sp. 14-2496-1d TaxID=2023146 RepID=UPI000B9B1E74|nr:hypothetical protein [Rhodococcus sp. 14-2496-1d]OZF29154.1 hypothetical protein CH296_18060 [Rhodococcus sp. 14-2496-1d]